MNPADAITAGDRRAAARLISRIEADDPTVAGILSALRARGRDTPVIGITGPPGAGKSTIVDQLIAHWRARNERVAVLAVDPSSPFTGGAILGDRVRMTRHNTDASVFIRSMSARGSLGGLAGATRDALIVLDAMGFDRIVIETVGAGQSEIDIAQHAHTVLVVQTPGSGDAIQAMKSGLLEIADVFIVNKSDAPGADRLVALLRETVEESGRRTAEEWSVPILKAQADNGVGIAEIDGALLAHARHLQTRQGRGTKASMDETCVLAHPCTAIVEASTMSEPELLTAIDGPIARITFNRPHVRNALTAGMVETMCKFLEQVELDPVVRCVVMTGAGEHFMAGGDVAGFAASLDEAPDDRRRSFEQRARVALPVFSIMERLSKPIIAKVRGAVAGASIGWVAASDLVLVSDTARFIAAHVLLGASPDGAISWHLPRNVGLRKAKEMVFFGDPLSAEEAVRFGLANRLVPDAQLDEQTEQWAQRLARGPGVAIGRAKQLLNRAHATGLMEQMDLEAQSFGACAGTEDFVEGVRAFLEKRKAQFKGQ